MEQGLAADLVAVGLVTSLVGLEHALGEARADAERIQVEEQLLVLGLEGWKLPLAKRLEEAELAGLPLDNRLLKAAS